MRGGGTQRKQRKRKKRKRDENENEVKEKGGLMDGWKKEKMEG